MIVDLRSDTVTRPTAAMRKAMAEAEVGDDVLGDDPTVQKLESLSAETLGKEAGLFVPSGTMGNLIALMVHAPQGTEVLLPAWSHIAEHTSGNAARIAGVNLKRMPTDANGRFDLDELARAIHTDDIHYAQAALICCENTAMALGGTVQTPDDLAALADLAHGRGLALHMDGARFFNGVTALGVSAAALAKPVDSVMFCLSKGLCAPIGSMLVGSNAFILEARRARKMLGGGMRQVGVIAAAGILSLTEMARRLDEDHARTRRLAEGLAALPGIEIDLDRVQSNLIFVETSGDLTADDLQRGMETEGVLAILLYGTRIRIVVHNDVNDAGIDRALNAAEKACKG